MAHQFLERAPHLRPTPSDGAVNQTNLQRTEIYASECTEKWAKRHTSKIAFFGGFETFSSANFFHLISRINFAALECCVRQKLNIFHKNLHFHPVFPLSTGGGGCICKCAHKNMKLTPPPQSPRCNFSTSSRADYFSILFFPSASCSAHKFSSAVHPLVEYQKWGSFCIFRRCTLEYPLVMFHVALHRNDSFAEKSSLSLMQYSLLFYLSL